MPVLRVSSRLSGGVLFQHLPSARQQILFHNSPSLKSSEIVVHDTTILERMQEVSSRIPENGKRGILRAGADKNTSRKNGIIDVTFLTENPTTKVRNKRKEAT